MYFPQQNVLAVGDAVSGEGWPVVDWVTGGWIGGIVGGLQRLQTLANEETRIVPGRGPVLGLAELKAQYEMYGTIYDRLTQLLNKGRGPSEAVAAQPTRNSMRRWGIRTSSCAAHSRACGHTCHQTPETMRRMKELQHVPSS